jgi:alpha-tubulin suppressor-like RCC1 family protein
MKRRLAPSLGMIFVMACTAHGRCDPSPSFSMRPVLDGGEARVPPSFPHCGQGRCLVERVSAGLTHTCATVRQDDGSRTVVCFGRNDSGQLGPAIPRGDHNPHARQISNVATVDVAASSIHTCAVGVRSSIRASVECFGTNVSALMGLDADDSFGSRTVVRTMDAEMTISLGSAHALVRFGGDSTMWGDNHFGQLGDRILTDYAGDDFGVGIFSFDGDAGSTATCFVMGDARVFCTGLFALEGQTLSSERLPDPEGVLSFGRRFSAVPELPEIAMAQVSVGMAHACAIDAQFGRVWCWGSNRSGEVGGDVTPDGLPGRPREVALPDRAAMVSAGGGHRVHVETPLRFTLTPLGPAHSCAITGVFPSTELWCWGGNDRGQLGGGSRGGSPEPRRVALPLPSMVSAGGAHTCAIAEGDLYCWGDNTYGQLGADPAEVASSDFPIAVDLGSPLSEREIDPTLARDR